MHKTLFAARDKVQRQAALIDAANAVFAERGFDAATTREIAERAGCAEGLIHRYFNGKHGLLLAILERKTPQVMAEFDAELPETDSLHQEIEQILLREIEAKWERRDFMRVCVARAAIDPEIGVAVRERVQLAQVHVIEKRLRKHHEAGRIRPGVDINAIAETLSGIGFAAGFMKLVAFGLPREEVTRIVKEAADALARGISATPREGTPQ